MDTSCLAHRLAALVVALGMLSVATPANAQIRRGQGRRIQGVRPEVHLDFGADDIGIGFRIDIPIIPDGFLGGNAPDDEFVLSPGIDLMFFDFDSDVCHNHDGRGDHCHDDDIGFWPVLMAQWNIYLNDKWSVFPELGIVFLIGDDYRRGHRGHGDKNFFVTPAASIGARWHFSRRMSLLMRLNFPAGAQIGLTF